MNKIILGTGEFLANSLTSSDFAGIETLEIEFANTVNFAEVQAFFDTNFAVENFTRMEVYSEIITGEVTTWELQGVHNGYTKPIDVSSFGGIVKAKIQRELAVETTVKQQETSIVELESMVAEMVYGGAK